MGGNDDCQPAPKCRSIATAHATAALARVWTIDDASKRWIEAGRLVAKGRREGLRCPENGDDDLVVEWLPVAAGRGEFLLRCPRCGARNFVLVGEHHEPPE
jgi:hypothetical protein